MSKTGIIGISGISESRSALIISDIKIGRAHV